MAFRPVEHNARRPPFLAVRIVRIALIDGVPWFVAADVCRILGLENTTKALERLDPDEFTLSQIQGSHRSASCARARAGCGQFAHVCQLTTPRSASCARPF
jgi:hypothetical protein